MDKLNGYWTKKDDPNITVYVEKVFKKGYVTGFLYKKLEEGGTAMGKFKVTHEELTEGYKREERKI